MKRASSESFAVCLAVLLVGAQSRAHETTPDGAIEIEVRGEPGSDSDAGQLDVSRRELLLRPNRRPGQLLDAAPGLVVVQHAGGGKADQYFLRGFDADHGTDVALFLNGVPLNQPSHGHGQGYADFNFVIPELIASLSVHKGPNSPRFGDFATAGALEVSYVEHLPENLVSGEWGQFGQRRLVAAVSPHVGSNWAPLLAVELASSAGPFRVSEDLEKLNFVAGLSRRLGEHGSIDGRLMAYGSSWNGSGQIPLRAVCGEGEPGLPAPESWGQPCLDRFGSVDPSEGGRTSRESAELGFETHEHGITVQARLFAVRYRFDLFSNFTFFANDPHRGDGIEQTDDRAMVGGVARLEHRHRLGAALLTSSFGLDARSDDIDNALYHQQSRNRLDTRNAAHIAETSTAAFVEERAHLTSWLATSAALRVERFQAQVEGRAATQKSGSAHALLPLPKFGLEIQPSRELRLFGSYGRGFHSNDARSAVGGRGTLLVPALGYEAGVKWKPLPGVELQGGAFLLDLKSELVWSGDEGTTEASPASRRMGVELGGRARLRGWLFADVEATLTRARFMTPGPADHVPLAPTATISAGLALRPRFGDYQPFGSYRVRAMADRPANEDATLTAPGYVVQDLSSGIRYRDIEAAVDVLNVFDVAWRPVNFATTSRLAYEPAPVTGLHFVPGWPRTILARASLYWR